MLVHTDFAQLSAFVVIYKFQQLIDVADLNVNVVVFFIYLFIYFFFVFVINISEVLISEALY